MAQDKATTQDKDTIPISKDHRALCGALDRLLTIGSYYQPSHERFQAVAKECLAALTKSVGSLPQLEIFINEQGLVIEKGLLGKDEVEARRLFDLLDPLQIALLEIDAAATSDHLHLALASLKKARNNLSGTRTYREIEIKGLPGTVRAISRALFLKTREVKPRPRKPRKAKPEVAFFEHNLISDLLLSGTDEGQKCEKEFIGIIQGIMATVDPTRIKTSGEEKSETAAEDWLPDEAIEAIKKVLSALAGTGSDLMNLQHLIAQAQVALEMTGDPELVELVFSRLQKDSQDLVRKRVMPKMIGKSQKGTRTDSRRKLIMSQQEMRDIVDGLEVPLGPMADPREQAGADCLSICLQVMDLAPTEELVTGIEETLLRLLTAGRLGGPLRETVVAGLQALLMGKDRETIGRIWPMFWGPLHRSHPGSIGQLWLDIWQGLSSEGREKAWAYLVNDLLLGMEQTNRIKHLLLLEALSKVPALGKSEIRTVLENLPALLEGTIADGFFDAPPPLLYPVHKVLVGCSFSGKFGPLLHESLVRQAPHRLSNLLLVIMDSYDPINRGVYHIILDQGIEEKLTPQMAELAPEIIQETLEDLHWDFMEEDWVIEAITWLGHLGRERALPVLNEILIEKKYVVLNGWPRPAREAARAARNELRERLGYKGIKDQETEPEGPEGPTVEEPLATEDEVLK
jgi:hypothetical protein